MSDSLDQHPASVGTLGAPADSVAPAPVGRTANERIILSLLRQRDSLSQASLAQLTGLSAQTVSVLSRRLQGDGLVQRGEPQRGRVGQPSVPLSLDPEGAFALGLKIGRRSADLVLIDFLGRRVGQRHRSYRFPMPDTVLAFVSEAAEALAALTPDRARIAGLGIATPFELWNWSEDIDVASGDMAVWRGFDTREEIGARVPWHVYVQNDATAACAAELVFGGHARLQDFLYIHVGTFVGGGVVIGGLLHAGRTGNAGAIGSMPVPGIGQRGAPVTSQLIDEASLFVLERRLMAAGHRLEGDWAGQSDWSTFGAAGEAWLEQAARALAHAAAAAASVIDFQAVLIDGGFPAAIRTQLVERTRRAMHRLDLQGIEPPVLMEGTLGPMARALGAASLPLSDQFLVERPLVVGEVA